MTACSLFVYLYLLDQNWKLLVTRDNALGPCSNFFLQCIKDLGVAYTLFSALQGFLSDWQLRVFF